MENFRSIWDGTKTYFPLLKERIDGKCLEICIVGASDGRFVVPLANLGCNVCAIENDPESLHGCRLDINGKQSEYFGIIDKIKNLKLEKFVTVIDSSFMDFCTDKKFDVVFTSSSWDCGKNDGTSIEKFVIKMQNLVRQGGIFCAEYMMKFRESHLNNPNLLDEGYISQFFKTNWKILDEFYTPVFDDIPHVRKWIPHKHRMGFIMANKII